MNLAEEKRNLILKLYDIGAVKFGSYKLKSGITSPVYFDLRIIISFPDVLISVSNYMWETVQVFQNDFSVICGVPYTALPIATQISTTKNVPMLIRRKEAKDYGTKKIIEGIFEKGSQCLIVEDVVTSGSSVWETVLALKHEGIAVTDAVVLLNREQGGSAMLKSKGISLHSVLSIHTILSCLKEYGKITTDTLNQVEKFIAENQTFIQHADGKTEGENHNLSNEISCYGMSTNFKNRILTYQQRGAACKNQVASKLFNIMHQKQTNLCLSADVDTIVELLEMADKLGPHICMLKTHVDILEDPSMGALKTLKELSAKHRFVIFEDRKFADIGNTVKMQYSGGPFRIREWAELTNAHSVPGPGVIEGLKAAVAKRKDRACLLMAQMSSKGNLADENYTKKTIEIAEDHSDFVIGFICVSKVAADPTLLHICPGVKLEPGEGRLGQQYLTPDEVIGKRGCDIIVVGSGITCAANRVQVAVQYKIAGWEAYLSRLNAN